MWGGILTTVVRDCVAQGRHLRGFVAGGSGNSKTGVRVAGVVRSKLWGL